MKKIKYIGEKRKRLSRLFQLRSAVVAGLNEDDPEKYNKYLNDMRKELNALGAA